MLSSSVNSALSFEQNRTQGPPGPSATTSFSATSALPKLVDLQLTDSPSLSHSSLLMGGMPQCFPFWNSITIAALPILIETTRQHSTNVAFRHRRGYRYQVVRTNRYPSRPAVNADAQIPAGFPAGAKGIASFWNHSARTHPSQELSLERLRHFHPSRHRRRPN